MGRLDTLLRAIDDERLSRAHLLALVAILDGKPTPIDAALLQDLARLEYLPGGVQ